MTDQTQAFAVLIQRSWDGPGHRLRPKLIEIDRVRAKTIFAKSGFGGGIRYLKAQNWYRFFSTRQLAQEFLDQVCQELGIRSADIAEETARILRRTADDRVLAFIKKEPGDGEP
ncbi:hypothetical protein [Roseobacter sp. S98]|uniref:hypothetical protein n=1 Tax=Roseobacter algicola (ex Choi et al. 2025) (nom. illeg.) TaxID=3092138 RepID=UPI003F511187